MLRISREHSLAEQLEEIFAKLKLTSYGDLSTILTLNIEEQV